MSQSTPPRSRRSSRAPQLPPALKKALLTARKSPEDDATWEELAEVCRELDRPEEAAELFAEVTDSDLPDSVRVRVGLRAADFCEEWFESTEPVLDMLGRVLRLAPSHQVAFERLTVLLTVASRWADLLAAYDAALAASASESDKARLLEEAAKVARDFAGDSQLGSDYLKQLLVLRPADDQLAAVLEKRLDEQGRHQDLVDIWTVRLSVLDRQTALSTRLLIAERQLDALEQADSALSSIDAYLAEGGQPQQALDLLTKTADSEAADVAVRRAALGKLQRIESDAHNWPAVVSAIERELRLISVEAEKTELHRQAATILERTQRPDEALLHATAVMSLEPTDEEVRGLARALAVRVGRIDRFVDALVSAAEHAQSEQQDVAGGLLRVELLTEAARLAEGSLGNADLAVDLYVRLADDPAAQAPALLHATRRLCLLLEAAGDRARLLVYLVRRAELEAEPAERREVLARAAGLAEELGDVDQSLSLWDARLSDDPADIEALTAKIELLGRVGRHAGLVEALEARVAARPDHPQSRADLILAAEIYDHHLADTAQAIERWLQVEARFGRDYETVDHLTGLLSKASRYEDLASLLSECVAAAEAEGVSDSARMVWQLATLGDLLRSHLERQADSVATYRKALTYAPLDEASRLGLQALLGDPALCHDAAESLADAYRVAGQPAELIALSETRIAAAPDAPFQAHILREVAQLSEQAQDVAAAAAALRRAFALLPDSETEAELNRVGELAGAWELVVSAYSMAISACEDPSRLPSLHLAKGAICESHLSDFPEATRAFMAALELVPEDEGTARSVIRAGLLAGHFQDAAWGLVSQALATGALSPQLVGYFQERAELADAWEDVLQALSDRIAAAEGASADLAHDLKQRLAIWYRDAAGDADSAEMVLRRAVEDAPKTESLRMLAELQRRAPGRPLIETLLTLSKVTGGELASLREAGEVAIAHVGDTALSRQILQHTFEIAAQAFLAEHPEGRDASGEAPPSEAEAVTSWTIDCLVEVEQSDHDPEAALELLARAGTLPFRGQDLVARRYQAAEAAAKGGLDDAAVSLGEELLEDVPDHALTIALLSTIHEAAGRLSQLLELRRRELSLTPPLERRLFLRLDQARVMGQLGADLDARLDLLAHNLGEAPGDENSVEAVAELLCEAERFEEATTLLEEQASVVAKADRVRAADMWRRAGLLSEERLGDLPRLQADFKASVAAHPEKSVLDRLAELARDAADAPQQVAWLEQRLGLTPQASEGEAATAERRVVVELLGRALVSAEEFSQARRLLEAELTEDPGADGARRILMDLYASFEEWRELSQLLTAGVDYAPSDEARLDYLKRAAQIERRHLGNVLRSVELLDHALQLAPTDRTLRLILADCLLESGGYARAREILRGLLEEFGRRRTKERATVHKFLARIARAEGALDEALSQAEEAAKIERMDPGILTLLAELARQRGELDRAEQAYRTLALVVSRRAAPAVETEEEQFGEAAILFELYQIAQTRGNEEQARELLSSALEVATRSSEEALRLEESLRNVGKVDLLLSAIGEQLQTAEGATAAGLLVTRAVILEKSDLLDDALESRLRAIVLTPGNGRLIDATRKLAERMAATDQWFICLRQLAETHDQRPELAGDLWLRLGRAVEDEGRLEDAAALYERAQLTGFKPRRTFLALDAVLSRLGDASRTEAALARFVAAPGADDGGDTLADALYRLAELELGSGRIGQGTERLVAATALRADDLRTIALAEPIVAVKMAPAGLVQLFLDAAVRVGSPRSRLLAYLEAAQLPDVTAGTLDAGVSLARDMGEASSLRLLLSCRIARAEQEGAVSDVLSEILERADLAEADGDAPLTVRLLEQAAAVAQGEHAKSLWLRAAGILVAQLGDLGRAASLYESLLEDAPGERRIWQPLLDVYYRAGRIDAVESCILLVEPHAEAKEDREVLRMARIRLMVGAGRLEEAEAALRATLEAEPDSEDAAQVLVELLRKAGREEELRDLLLELFDKARNRGDARQVASYGLEVAELFGHDPVEAASILASALSLVTGNEAYLRQLLALQTEETSLDDRALVLEYLIGATSGVEAEQFAFQLAALCRDQGDDIGLGRALELGYAKVPESQALGDAVVEYLRIHEDFGRLAEVLMKRASSRPEAELAVAEFAEAAFLFGERLGEPARAAEALLASYARRSDDPLLLRRGVDYLVAAGEIDQALSYLGQAIAQREEVTLADLLDQRARILETERSDDPSALEQAAADLREALELLLSEEQEEDIQARRVAILTTLRQVFADGEEAEQERRVMLELTDQLESRGRVAEAVSVLMSWAEEHPEDLLVTGRLGAAAKRAGDADAALLAYQRIFDSAQGEQKRAAAISLAAIAEQSGDPMRAREALEETFRELPGDDEVRSRLRDMYEAAGAFRELADLLMAEAASTEDPETRFQLLVDVGELYLRAGDTEAACDMFESARQAKPDSYLIVTKLAKAYVEQDQVDRAQAALDEALEQHGKRRTPELALLQHGLAIVAEARGDLESMFTWLEAALMSDRANGQIAAELAVRAQDTGRYDLAIKALQVIALTKGETPMSKAEAYYRQAQIADEQGDQKKALMLARRATTADGEFEPAVQLVSQLS